MTANQYFSKKFSEMYEGCLALEVRNFVLQELAFTKF